MKNNKLLILFSFIILIYSCKPDDEIIITDPGIRLRFSTDTILFDTVFTSVGSVTKRLKVYNDHKNAVNIKSISLDPNSPYSIIIDGQETNITYDHFLRGGDSLYILVKVTITPGGIDTVFIEKDSIVFNTNGNFQDVKLVAWGEDALFFNGDILCNTTWTSDKPYVIYNYIIVDSLCTLTIQDGVRVYSDINSGIFVKGNLVIVGIKDAPVTFQGIRLEDKYDDVPGQWLGIFILRGSTGNIIDHAVVKNAQYGISVGSSFNPDLTTYTFENAPDIKIKHTIIKNMLFTGLFGFLSFIEAENCLIYNCGEHNAQLAFGGIYDFNHVTLANYNTFISPQDPILRLGNFALNPQGLFVAGLDATFTNCIIYGYGDQGEEIAMDDTIASFDYLFENCFLKTQMDISGANFIATVKNVDPEFVMTSEDDYHLEATSPCIEAGKSTLVTDDLEETPRDFIKPDIGAYEYMP